MAMSVCGQPTHLGALPGLGKWLGHGLQLGQRHALGLCSSKKVGRKAAVRQQGGDGGMASSLDSGTSWASVAAVEKNSSESGVDGWHRPVKGVAQPSSLLLRGIRSCYLMPGPARGMTHPPRHVPVTNHNFETNPHPQPTRPCTHAYPLLPTPLCGCGLKQNSSPPRSPPQWMGTRGMTGRTWSFLMGTVSTGL